MGGRTVTTNTDIRGSFNYNSSGSYSNYGWGTYDGTSTSSTYIPGYSTTQSYTRPGYTVERYHPSVSIAAYDAETNTQIWHGEGSGISANPDLRVSSQVVIAYVIGRFPPAVVLHKELEDLKKNNLGRIGTAFRICTLDGESYYPMVIGLLKKSPAKRASIKDYDIIISVDGVSTQNKSSSEVFKLLISDPDTTVMVNSIEWEKYLIKR